MASPMFNSYNKLLVANKEPDTRCTFCGGDCSRTTIRRGVTTTHTFNLPCSIGLINKILIIYKQNNKVILEKDNFWEVFSKCNKIKQSTNNQKQK